VGRRIDNFNHSIRYSNLVADIEEVIRSENRIERGVFDSQGNAYLLRILPYRAPSRVEGAVLTLVDVSSLRRAESAVRRMSKVFMDSTDPIVIEDLQGRILDLNSEAEQVFGVSREEILGGQASDLVPPEKRDEEFAFREKCRRGEKVRNIESVRTDGLGRSFPVLLAYSLLAGDDGKPAAIATIVKDISERKQAETEALMGVRRRDQFLAMLSHELRNPLAAVLSASHVISRSPHDPETVLQAREIIDRQARQAARLLDDLLDIGRMTQGKIQLKQTVVDFAQVTREAAEAIQPLVEARNHHLDLHLPEAPLYVHGDPARLHQVIENLLTNAAKYTPHGGKIELRLERTDAMARLVIRDSGIGIAAENLEEIFGLFTQLDSSLDRSDRGLGIGLSMVQMLVQMHGGSVCAKSDGLGQGSSFEVQLPLVDAPPEIASELENEPQSAPVTVLIIEDIEDTRRIMKRLLSLDGHQVREAADGHAGLAALISDPPDVALVDVGLPGISGYEVARIARKNPALNRVRLIALTGYGRPEDREAVLAAGFDEHLVKPVNLADLTRILNSRA
jgi:two-component system CheB/CheR fusion protein